jgi:predicted O-linked N-acetylglucosamine transferase (SPINDLY family)
MNSNLHLMLQQGIQTFQDGNFDGAELILKRLLQADSKNLPALHILGLINASQSNYKKAADYLARAAKIDPTDPSIQYNLAKALSDSGNDKEALVHHKKAVSLAPNNPEAWLNYGKTASNLGRYDDALVFYSNALNLEPYYAEALLNKGATLKELKRLEEAIVFAEQALALNADLPEAWLNKGVALKELKRLDEALVHYDKALSLKPDYHEGWTNKGTTLYELKRFDEALVHYDKALSLKPDYHEAWTNKGVSLHELKRFDEALVHYDKALSLKPDYHEGWSNKGTTLYELKRFDEALVHYDKALSLKPEYVNACFNKGLALLELKRYDEGIAYLSKTLSLNPRMDWVIGELIHAKMKICSWSSLADYIENLSMRVMANERVTQPLALKAFCDSPQLHKICSETYVQAKYPLNQSLGTISKRLGSQKIRVGYFSADLKKHPVAFLLAQLFEIHDRDRFEIYAFSLLQASDEMRDRLVKAFDHFVNVDTQSDKQIAELSRNLGIDIAVDLTGHTKDSRTGIFSYRTAPIQVNWLGYPGTMGTDYIDYVIADKVIIPESHHMFYKEKIVYLPHTYIVDDSKRIASSKVFTRGECGLPENSFIFCCFNNDHKFNPQMLDCWSRILKSTKDSILWISENNEIFSANIKIEFQNRDVDPKRIIFAKRVESMEDYLARYALADVFLDTHPYNAHTTAVDSLKAGIPLITLIGQSFASRVAASLLNAIGLPELITKTQEEYETLAIELAKNPQKLAEIKKKLAENRLTAPLFDTPLFTKNLEAAYIKMHERYHNNRVPDHLYID